MKQKDELIEQSEAQCDPYRARPEHFKIVKADEASRATVAFHGHHGDTDFEHRKLLRNADSRGKSPLTGSAQQLNPPVERHGAPRTAFLKNSQSK